MKYFNHTLFQGYTINSKAKNKAREVTLSAKELSTGITKLSGSRPLLKVKIEIEYVKMTIAATARMLATSTIKISVEKEENENVLCINRDKTARIINIKIEADQALKMVFAWFRIEEKEGVSKPKASFVVAVEPITEPTLPIMPIKAV